MECRIAGLSSAGRCSGADSSLSPLVGWCTLCTGLRPPTRPCLTELSGAPHTPLNSYGPGCAARCSLRSAAAPCASTRRGSRRRWKLPTEPRRLERLQTGPRTASGRSRTKSKWKYGVVLRTTGKIIDFECPIDGTRFGAGGGIRVPVPLGMSAYSRFGTERELPKMALPRSGD